MVCKRCAFDNHDTFNGEIAIHFPGLKVLKHPLRGRFQSFWSVWSVASRRSHRH
jgi:hypothetical protein